MRRPRLCGVLVLAGRSILCRTRPKADRRLCRLGVTLGHGDRWMAAIWIVLANGPPMDVEAAQAADVEAARAQTRCGICGGYPLTSGICPADRADCVYGPEARAAWIDDEAGLDDDDDDLRFDDEGRPICAGRGRCAGCDQCCAPCSECGLLTDRVEDDTVPLCHDCAGSTVKVTPPTATATVAPDMVQYPGRPGLWIDLDRCVERQQILGACQVRPTCDQCGLGTEHDGPCPLVEVP